MSELSFDVEKISHSSKKISLINYGINPYLNDIIEAVSSCSVCVFRLELMENGKTNLPKLALLNKLIKIINTNQNLQFNIIENKIFAKLNNKNNIGFECLAYLLNRVYNEKRNTYIDSSLNFWLKKRLPLRIVMQYVIDCECGYTSLSSGQSELSLTVTNSSSTTNLQNLVNNYFKDVEIDGKVCDKKECKSNTGIRRVKLLLPLSETLCINLVGNSPSQKLQNCMKLIINKDFCVLSPEKDLVYFLKSVVISGQQGCYKKIKEDWFFVRDEEFERVEEITVLSCKPYLFFYEIKNLENSVECTGDEKFINIPLSMIDYCISSGLNTVIHALAACSSVVSWLGCVDEDDNDATTRTISRLIRLANNDVNSEISVDVDDIENLTQYQQLDIYQLLKKILTGLFDEINFINNEANRVIDCSPWRLFISDLIKCGCGSSMLNDTDSKMLLTMTLMEGQSKNIQELFDEYFQEDDVDCHEHGCVNRGCSVNKITRRRLLHHPLPALICIEIEKDDNTTFNLTEQLFLRGNFFTINDGGNKKLVFNQCRIYKLHSVILSDGCTCYRKMDNEWFIVNERLTEKIIGVEDEAIDVKIMFYQLLNEEEDDIATNTVDMSRSIIYALSSCTKFIEWLDMLSYGGADINKTKTLLSLINVVNGVVEEECEIDEDVRKQWSEDRYTVLDIMKEMLNGIIKEFEEDSRRNKKTDNDRLPLVIYNYCIETPTNSETKFIKNISFVEKEEQPLQALVDQCFEIWSGYHELHITSCTHIITLPLSEGLLETIGFHFDGDNDNDRHAFVRPSMSIVVKNKSCKSVKTCLSHYSSCCRKYVLRSIIDLEGFSYRIVDNKVFRVVDCRCVFVGEEEFLAIRPRIMILEKN